MDLRVFQVTKNITYPTHIKGERDLEIMQTMRRENVEKMSGENVQNRRQIRD